MGKQKSPAASAFVLTLLVVGLAVDVATCWWLLAYYEVSDPVTWWLGMLVGSSVLATPAVLLTVVAGMLLSIPVMTLVFWIRGPETP